MVYDFEWGQIQAYKQHENVTLKNCRVKCSKTVFYRIELLMELQKLRELRKFFETNKTFVCPHCRQQKVIAKEMGSQIKKPTSEYYKVRNH